ncbi:MAG: M67 family metallopeptidase [Bellilinea sp.]|jgi:proteasome lid subunit RPN8/RPN11
MTEILFLTQEQIAEMKAHVESCAPEEGCGLLAGRDHKVELTILITNQTHSPVRYNMEPRELIAALYKIEERGLELLASFHSHPNGPAVPSESDVKEYAYPETYMLILSKTMDKWKVKGFRIIDETHSEIELRIV